MVKKSNSTPKMGRPHKDVTASKTLAGVRVTEESMEAYKDKAKEQGLSFSEWVRVALNKALKSK